MEDEKYYTDQDEAWLAKIFLDGLRPEQDLTVSEWSDSNRILSSVASAEPGPWRTERFPFLKEIMDALSSNSETETIVFMKGAQVGATECGNNWIGYIIDQAPGPALMVVPTIAMAKDNSKIRLATLIEESPVLKLKVKEPRERDSGNTTLMKEFPGGYIALVGANSPSGLSSKPIRYLFLDEIDRYPSDAGQEGDPISIAMARTRTFSRRKIFMASTPTISRRSRIEKAFSKTDQRKYFVPCPHCNFKQVLVWRQIKWINEDPKTTHYECENCNQKIYNHDKNLMLANGEWRRTVGGSSKSIGFHLSALYSPVGFFSWEDAVSDFLKAKNDTLLLKSFINLTLGEVWEERGEAPEYEKLFNRREKYEIGTVPKGGLLLVAGADIQQDRIEVEIVAYGRDKRSWSVEYLVFPGDPSQPAIWAKMDELLSKKWIHESGIEIGLSGIAVDSGYKPEHVYTWTRKKERNRVFAVKGQDSLHTIYSGVRVLDIRLKDGKRIARGARLWPVGVSVIKTELYDFLRQGRASLGEVEPYGYCYFPEYPEEYFRQLVAEQLISKMKKNGQIIYEWKKLRERNEALDCRVYARAAAALIGMDRFTDKHWRAYETIFNIKKEISVIEEKKEERPIQKKSARRFFSKGITLD